MDHPANSRPRRPIWPVLILAAIVAAAATVFWPTGDPAPRPDADPDRNAQPSGPEPDTAAPAASEAGAPRSDPVDREPARVAYSAGPQTEQGLLGRLVTAQGAAVAGATVHLLESVGNDPLLVPLMQRQHHFLAPVASTRSAMDGTFAVGLEVAQDKIYDLYVISDAFATLRLTGLRVVSRVWHDLGELPLDAGAILRGRVTIAGRPGMPAPNAVVTLGTGSPFADAAAHSLPDNEANLAAHTDANGYYELRRVPTSSAVQVTAIAPGFAAVIERDVEIVADENQLDFELPAGHTLLGAVRDEAGEPIDSARIRAWPNDVRAPPLLAFSDEQGAFTVPGVRDAPHRLRVTHAGFATEDTIGVRPGIPAAITLRALPSVEVTVRDPFGSPVRRYRLGIRRFFATDTTAPLTRDSLRTGRIGSVPEVVDRRIDLPAGSDTATIRSVPAGTFVCEVEADGYAVTRSIPFDLDGHSQTAAPRRVEVVLTPGHTLRGQVVDSFGNGLAGARVTTQLDGMMPDIPLVRMLARSVPTLATGRTVTTDAAGRFAIERLALAGYQLQIEHDAACRTVVRGLDCHRPGATVLPTVRMLPGCTVHGRATIDGLAGGQIRLILTTPATVAAADSIRMETVTDGEGRYRFPRRIPPGSYELRAAAVGRAPASSEIFHQLLQLNHSPTSFAVAAGQDVHEQDIDLPAVK